MPLQTRFHGGIWQIVSSLRCFRTPRWASRILTQSLVKYRVLENGSRTQSRLAVTESVMAPFSDGTPFCIHKKHEEGFYVTVCTFSDNS